MENKGAQIELTKSIDDQIAKMKDRSDISAMDYFYESAKKMYQPRKSQGSKKSIGVFCNMVPEELIYAGDAIPFRICGGFQGTISVSERILPQVYCPLIKSTVGFFMKDMLDHLDLIVIPTTCDGKKKAAEILSEKKTTMIMEVPHTITTPQARELWLKEVFTLKKKLAKHLGVKITKKALRVAIEKTNMKRQMLIDLYELRKDNPPISGSDALLVAHMSFYDDIDPWIAGSEKLLAELKARKSRGNGDAPRVMLTGSPMILPTWKIPLLIEDEGAVIVMDDLCSAAKTLLRKVEVRSWTLYDMLIGLADHYLMSACPCFVPNDARIKRILNLVDEYRIDGVVYHNLQGCQLYGGEAWRVESELKKRDVPVLKLETSYGEGDVKQLKIRTDAFLEMLEARKED